MISDEAVEAAARIYEPDLWAYFDKIGDGAAGSPVALMRNNSLGLARRVLEAAAPFIAAQAPVASPKVKGNTPQGRIRELLKHLDYWESQEHKTVTIAYLRRHFKDAGR